MNKTLTFHHAQQHQPWTVPYSAPVNAAAHGSIPHILATHTALHAAKSVGKIAAVFENRDHVGESMIFPTEAERARIAAMSADLVTAALRLANLCDFDLATELLKRIEEKNGVALPPL